MTQPSTDSFPRLHARTRRFTLGAPRGVTVSPDGGRVAFLRSRGGTDPVTCLWSLEVATGEERLVADPRELDDTDVEDVPAEERARRERAREQAGGVVGYATDRALTRAVFPLSGNLYLAEFAGGLTPRLIETDGAVIDPRLDPTGARIAFVSGGALHVHLIAARTTHTLLTPEADEVTYGLADFVAAEEIDRMRGHWWSPEGDRLVVARVDEAAVPVWHIADPANPERTPAAVRYPAAGTTNPAVSLEVVGLDGARTPIVWDVERDEYVVDVVWDDRGLFVVVQPRDQKALRMLAVDPVTGATTLVDEETDPVWVDATPGLRVHTASGALVKLAHRDGAHRVLVDGEPVTPPEIQVRGLLDVDGDTLLISGSTTPAAVRLWTWTATAGLVPASPEEGVHSGRLAGGTLVRASTDLTSATVTTVRAGEVEREIVSHAADPGLGLRISLHRAGERRLQTALLLPSWWEPGTPLPVLMDPYGGPHGQRVYAARNPHLTSQWFAEQGFAVVVVDGRGMPGRGPGFERAVHLDLARPVLEDQIDALRALAVENPDLDLTRVGIRGWSFGGFLAALAVLRRPDVFHAAVAGAPVTDWELYDTHYTERYLGRPDVEKAAYERSSLLADAAAPATEDRPNRPLMIIHGLADDNVVAAHTLRLSSALLAAGRPHQVLPLSGVTHMTPQEVVAENLLLLQVRFLRDALGVPAPPA
ncbi:prolyl oligopeptidase family serine peptidase [Pseudonocardia lutea]|uniref:Prolyl oligopeptidase family serine peptidase n=1 Tax=Pseudonocardia lutea TaxID=2172015 RepID=A0ABW1I0H7_9PSEU